MRAAFAGAAAIGATLAVLVAGGCMPRMPQIELSQGDIPVLERGMSVSQVEDALEGRTYWKYVDAHTMHPIPFDSYARCERVLEHKFTVVDESGREAIIASSRIIVPMFYLLFIDGRLERIALVVTLKGPESERLKQLLAVPEVPPEEIGSVITAAIPAENRMRRSAEPPPIAPIWPIVAEPFMNEEASFFRSHDGMKLRIGATQDEVTKSFGRPDREVLIEPVTHWIYFFHPRDPEGSEPSVVVDFVDGRVVRVRTDG